jgi:hypothetical protein
MANIAQAQVILEQRRGGFILACGGFTYQKNQQTSQKMFWRCTDRSCPSTVHTNVFPVALGKFDLCHFRRPS